MPPSTRDYFKIAANRIDAKTIAERTNLRRADAHKMLGSLADRLTKNADGSWALPPLTSVETNLVECVSSYFVVKPAFESDRLVEDFLSTLKSNGLISKDELRDHRVSLRLLVELCAVAVMHNCVVQIGDGTTTQLRAAPQGEQIVVNATVPNAFPDKAGVSIACSIFTVSRDPSLHCHPDLVEIQNWDCEIEISPDKKLAPLR